MSLDDYFGRHPKRTTTYHLFLGNPRSIREVVAALKAPIPNAAQVSATVARQWHEGLAEDARRRAKPWRFTATLYKAFGRHDPTHAEAMADYFESLAAKHLDQKGLTP